jgi:hypothetical protein
MIKMPTLEVQLAKAQKDLDALPPSNTMYWFMRRRKADDYHGDDAKARGLMERVSHLQQRIAVRNERAEQRAAAQTLTQAAVEWVQTYEPIDLPTHTSAPTAPE